MIKKNPQTWEWGNFESVTLDPKARQLIWSTHVYAAPFAESSGTQTLTHFLAHGPLIGELASKDILKKIRASLRSLVKKGLVIKKCACSKCKNV